MQKPYYRYFIALLLSLTSFTTAIAQPLSEGFESGLPGSGSSTATNYSLSSGTWTILKGAGSSTKHSGSFGLKLSSGNSTVPTFAAAPALSNISTTSFWAKGSSSTTVTIQKSVNGGSYTTVASVNITTTFTLYTVTVNEPGNNVRIKLANATSKTVYIDDVSIASGTVTPTALLSINPSTLAFGDVTVNTVATEKTYSVSGSALSPAAGNVTITAPAGYEISTTTGTGFTTTLSLPYTSGSLAAKTIYVRFKPTAVQAYTGNITNTGGGAATKNISVSGNGVAVATPTLIINPSALAFGDVAINTVSTEKTYTLSGSALSPAAGNITVTTPAGYEISTTTSTGFTTTLLLPYTSGNLAAKTIYLRFKPTAAQAYTGNISNAGGSATTKNISVSGNGVVPGSIVTINFAEDATAFHNPERGLYRYSIAKTSNYVTLTNAELQAIRNEKISLLFRYFVLDANKNSALSQATLDKIQQDLNTIRANGMKLVARFSYVDESDGAFTPPHNDAPKNIVLQHISQLKPLFQNNADVIYILQAGFIGIWGEWYYTDYFGSEEIVNAQNIADRKAVTDSLLGALPASRMIALRTPKWKTTLYGYNITSDTLKVQDAYGSTAKARLAGHNDCFLADYNDYTFSDTATEKKYWAAESNYYSMGGESCNDDATYTNCTNALKELKRFHWSYINDGYHPGVLNRWKNNGCYTEIEKKIGYRFRLLQANIQNNAVTGDSLRISISITNDGWSRLVNKRKAELILKNNSTNSITKIPVTTGTIQLWLPAPSQTKTLLLNCKLPGSLAAGSYSVYLNFPDDYASLALNKDYSIRLANLNTWEATTGYNLLYNNLTVAATLSRPQGSKQATLSSTARNTYIYPNPVKKGGILYLSNQGNKGLQQTIKIFDVSGKLVTQKIVLNNQLAIDINPGMYIISLQGKDKAGSYPLLVE